MKFYVDEDVENIKEYLTENNGESEWLEAIQQAKENGNTEDLQDKLEDYLLLIDAITGSGSDSYYFNTIKVKKTVLAHRVIAHLEEVIEAYKEYNLDIGKDLANGNWERMDVTARCYYLHEAANNFIKSYILTLAINNKERGF